MFTPSPLFFLCSCYRCSARLCGTCFRSSLTCCCCSCSLLLTSRYAGLLVVLLLLLVVVLVLLVLLLVLLVAVVCVVPGTLCLQLPCWRLRWWSTP
jgi:hypothetical protein